LKKISYKNFEDFRQKWKIEIIRTRPNVSDRTMYMKCKLQNCKVQYKAKLPKIITQENPNLLSETNQSESNHEIMILMKFDHNHDLMILIRSKPMGFKIKSKNISYQWLLIKLTHQKLKKY